MMTVRVWSKGLGVYDNREFEGLKEQQIMSQANGGQIYELLLIIVGLENMGYSLEWQAY